MYRNLILATGVSLALGACATNPKVSAMDVAINNGGEIVEFLDLIGDTGVTFKAVNGDWFNYLSQDGRKAVKVVTTGVFKELTWRVNDDGVFCQQMFATEKEACGNVTLVKASDGYYYSYSNNTGKAGSPFTLVQGNSENL